VSSLVEEIIAEIADSANPLLSSRLVELSNLSRDEMGLLERVWLEIEPERRRQIISRLVELAEDNFELDFDNIFRYSLRDTEAQVRWQAIEGLWESEETSLIEPLVNLLESDSSEKVQAAAATALGRFAMLAEHEMLRSGHKARISQVLLAVIDDDSKSVEVRRRALEAASPLCLSQVNAAIMKAYQSDNHRLRVSAVYAMGKNCNAIWLPLLRKELTSSDSEMRYEAVLACGELGEEKVVPSLCELVADPDTDVRLAAIRALGEIGGSKARECLSGCLQTSNELIRETAEQALYELGVWEDPQSFKI